MQLIFLFFYLFTSQNTNEFFLETLREKLKEIEDSREFMTMQTENIMKYLDLLVEHREVASALIDSLSVRRDIMVRDSIRLSTIYKKIAAKNAIYDTLLSDKLRELYKHGNPTALEVFLSEESFSDFVTRMEYFSKTTEEIVKIIYSAQDIHFVLRMKLDSLNNMLQRLDTFQNEIILEKERIINDSIEMTQVLLKLDSSMLAQETLEEELKLAEEEISKEVRAQHRAAQIAASYNNNSSNNSNNNTTNNTTVSLPPYTENPSEIVIAPENYFEINKGNIIMPLEGEIINNYGKGFDIVAEAGTPVKAVAPGVVIYINRFNTIGNAVMINHGNMYFTYYTHLASPVAVSLNARVESGDVIGSVGYQTTGRSKIRFEIRISGVVINTYEYLKGN